MRFQFGFVDDLHLGEVNSRQSELRFTVRMECSFELLEKVVNEFVPAVENGISHSRRRVTHHAHIFLHIERKNLFHESRNVAARWRP